MGRPKKPKIPGDSEIVDLLKARVLVSHAVTLAPEEYIKKSTVDFLTSYLLQLLGVVVVNNDPKNLETAMLFSSFKHPNDLALLLHGCVSSTGGARIVSTKDTEKIVDVEGKKRRELETQLHNCSLEEIIEHVKESMGAPRIKFFEKAPDSTLASLTALASGIATGIATGNSVTIFSKSDRIGSFIRVEKPAEINYSKLDFSHITTDAALDTFLYDIIKYEAGLSDTLDIAIELFDSSVGKLFSRMAGWEELACREAKVSDYNNISFEVVADPWAALFNGL